MKNDFNSFIISRLEGSLRCQSFGWFTTTKFSHGHVKTVPKIQDTPVGPDLVWMWTAQAVLGRVLGVSGSFLFGHHLSSCGHCQNGSAKWSNGSGRPTTSSLWGSRVASHRRINHAQNSIGQHQCTNHHDRWEGSRFDQRHHPRTTYRARQGSTSRIYAQSTGNRSRPERSVECAGQCFRQVQHLEVLIRQFRYGSTKYLYKASPSPGFLISILCIFWSLTFHLHLQILI